MSKHTPGNWIHDSQEALHIRAEDGGLIATLGWSNGRHFSKGRRTAEEVMANARLLAAAPELLEALKTLLLDVQEYEAWQRPCHALDLARAAIAKAEGKQP